jgi:hypothetical protein
MPVNRVERGERDRRVLPKRFTQSEAFGKEKPRSSAKATFGPAPKSSFCRISWSPLLLWTVTNRTAFSSRSRRSQREICDHAIETEDAARAAAQDLGDVVAQGS